MNLRTLALLAAVGMGAGLAACDKNEGPMEETKEALGDATDSRDNEGLKDAGEDMKDAAQNAKEGVKDAVDGDNN
jgi:hypothetical protein